MDRKVYKVKVGNQVKQYEEGRLLRKLQRNTKSNMKMRLS